MVDRSSPKNGKKAPPCDPVPFCVFVSPSFVPSCVFSWPPLILCHSVSFRGPHRLQLLFSRLSLKGQCKLQGLLHLFIGTQFDNPVHACLIAFFIAGELMSKRDLQKILPVVFESIFSGLDLCCGIVSMSPFGIQFCGRSRPLTIATVPQSTGLSAFSLKETMMALASSNIFFLHRIMTST